MPSTGDAFNSELPRRLAWSEAGRCPEHRECKAPRVFRDWHRALPSLVADVIGDVECVPASFPVLRPKVELPPDVPQPVPEYSTFEGGSDVAMGLATRLLEHPDPIEPLGDHVLVAQPIDRAHRVRRTVDAPTHVDRKVWLYDLGHGFPRKVANTCMIAYYNR
jgi:hypothetical protein